MFSWNIKKPSEAGFSLLETMAAIAILVVSFISLSQVFPYGLAIKKGAEGNTMAAYLAQEKVENIIAQGYDNIATGTVETKSRLASSTTDYLYYYQREAIVSLVDGNLAATSTDAGIKKIQVNVYYIGATKKENVYQIITLTSKN